MAAYAPFSHGAPRCDVAVAGAGAIAGEAFPLEAHVPARRLTVNQAPAPQPMPALREYHGVQASDGVSSGNVRSMKTAIWPRVSESLGQYDSGLSPQPWVTPER